MKLSTEQRDGRLTVHISGDVLGSSCNCLEHFWDRHDLDEASDLRLDLSGISEIDTAAAEQICTLIDRSPAHASPVQLVWPPRTLLDIMNARQMFRPVVLEATSPSPQP